MARIKSLLPAFGALNEREDEEDEQEVQEEAEEEEVALIEIIFINHDSNKLVRYNDGN